MPVSKCESAVNDDMDGGAKKGHAEVVADGMVDKKKPILKVVKLPKTVAPKANRDDLSAMMAKLTVVSSKEKEKSDKKKNLVKPPGDYVEDDSGKEESGEEEVDEYDYTERGPMMSGRRGRNRKHPYDYSSSSDSRSVSSGIDSESSDSSSPEASPSHSVSIVIPSRHFYGPAGIVTVYPQSPQQGSVSGGSPPQNKRERNRSARMSGGGLVSEEVVVVGTSPGAIPPPVSFFDPSCSVQAQAQHLSPAPPPPSVTPQNNDIASFSMPSPYSTYREPLSHSPLSVSSHFDDLSIQHSPESEEGQFSPFGTELLDIGAYLPVGGSVSQSSSCGDLAALQVTRSSSYSDIEILDKPELSLQVNSPSEFFGLSSAELDKTWKTLFEDDLEPPNPKTDFPDIACDDDLTVSLKSTAMIETTQCVAPILVVPQQQQPTRRSSQPHSRSVSPSQPSCKGRSISKPDIDAEYVKALNKYVKILPRPESSTYTTASCVTSLGACGGGGSLKTSVSGLSPSPPTVASSTEAVDRMRRLFTDREKNAALSRIDGLGFNALCSPDESGDTILHIAICRRKFAIVYAIVSSFVSNGKSLDIRNNEGQTPLFVAVFINNPTMVEFLLYHGASAGCVCRDGSTSLHLVAAGGDLYHEVACILLKSPSSLDFSRRNKQGLTALHLAVQRHNKPRSTLRIVELLLQKGASLNDEELHSRKTPLHFAVDCDDLEMVKILCDNCRDIASAINATTYDQNTPLHLAAMSKQLNEASHVNLIKLLFKYGANPNMKNNERKLPRDLVSQDRLAIIRPLLQSKMRDRNPTS